MKVMAIDSLDIFPCVEISYYDRFLLNTVALPLFLLFLVELAWLGRATQKDLDKNSDTVDDDLANVQRLAQNRKSDFFMAFFLVYPKISQTVRLNGFNVVCPK